MNKLCVASLGLFLLTLHLSQVVVLAQNSTAAPNVTTAAASNYTMMPTSNSTVNTTAESGCGRSDAFTLLLPLALSACLLHSWS